MDVNLCDIGNDQIRLSLIVGMKYQLTRFFHSAPSVSIRDVAVL